MGDRSIGVMGYWSVGVLRSDNLTGPTYLTRPTPNTASLQYSTTPLPHHFVTPSAALRIKPTRFVMIPSTPFPSICFAGLNLSMV